MLCAAIAAYAQSPDYSQIAGAPVLASTFEFTRTNGKGASGDLSTAGSKTVPLTPCPKGVNGSDARHYVYISGGTGTAEAVLITGGTCTSLATTGTLTFTTTQTHTGAWVISSASGGIQEAVSYLGNEGTVKVRNGCATVNLYATTVVSTDVSLIGDGMNCLVLEYKQTTGPAIVVADGNGSGTGGMGKMSGLTLKGQGAAYTTSYGLWLGRDPSGVFTPDTWSGSYYHTEGIAINHFGNSLHIQRANFVRFRDSNFSIAENAVYVANDTETGEGIEFAGCVIAAANYGLNLNAYYAPITFFNGSIDYNTTAGITGTGVWFTSYGTFFEALSGAHIGISASGTHTINIHGGYMVYNPLAGTITNMIGMTGGGYYRASFRNIHMQVPTGVTVTNLINFSAIASGALEVVGNIGLDAGGTITNRVVVSGTTNVNVQWPQQTTSGFVPVTAAATLAMPGLASGANYPLYTQVVVTGATVGGSGITAVSGLTAGHHGVFYTTFAQTFTAGATIGNTVTTTPGLPYYFVFDGTQLWIK